MIDVDELAGYQNKNLDHGFLYYVTADGQPFCRNEEIGAEATHIPNIDSEKDYFITDGDTKYLVTNNYSDKAHLQILYFMPYNSSIPTMKKMQMLLFVLSLVIVLFIPLLYRMLAKSFFTPIDKLNSSMQHIRDGVLNEKADENFIISEFRKVNMTFNELMSEIKNLKIDSYEKELQKNEAELQYSQLQW